MTGMVFCRGCGKEIHHTAPMCPMCGAPQAQATAVLQNSDQLPPGIAGWSWGAFLLNWIWAIGNRTWIGLLALIPYVGFIMAIILGIYGREWAWKNGKWDSVEHFNRVQRTWSLWGVWLIVIIFFVAMAAAIALPAYSGYRNKSADGACLAEAKAWMSSSVAAVMSEMSVPHQSGQACASASQSSISAADVEAATIITFRPVPPGAGVIQCQANNAECQLSQ